MDNAIDIFVKILKDNREGKHRGIYSVCSAQPDVIKASMLQAAKDGSIILIESTSNQVDQFGGYTGMKPADFIGFVHKIADSVSFPKNRILLGGDHLGPNAWKNLDAAAAMENAKTLVYEYVKAGFQKIHLDASMFCKDDKGDRSKPLDDKIVSERAAVLCEAAEKSWKENRSGFPKPVYIIGTEVPIPGGAQEEEDHVNATEPGDVDKTIATAKEYFTKLGLTDAWERVCGIVVQPGVEFGDDSVFDFKKENASRLSGKIENYKQLVYEAHSTDYQTESGLTELVKGHFCILKVGPWLTFAYRQALFALESIERDMLSLKGVLLSNIRETLEKVMLDNPDNWKKYYHGDATDQFIKRKYSFSDRSRYYWPNENLVRSKDLLIKNLRSNKIPLSILYEYMPNQYDAVRNNIISIDPEQLIVHKVQEVLSLYSKACGMKN